jgi:hypothetical protein
MAKRNVYRIWVEWLDGRSQYLNLLFSNKRDAERKQRQWQQVALISKVSIHTEQI